MSKFGKKVSDKLDEAASVVIRTGERLGGDVGYDAANVLSAVILGRYWKSCSDNCGCPDEAHD
ncbi:hypothetical protein ACWGHD_04450 [Streptomyces xanthophaeus]